jgi:hypothetical protein
MKFCVIYQRTSHNAHSPVRVVEQSTGQGVGWINRYLDREYVRRLANTTMRTFAYNLLHFVRWWESVHHTGEIREVTLPSPRPDYVRFRINNRGLPFTMKTAWPSPSAPSATVPNVPAKSPAVSSLLARPWARAASSDSRLR